MKNSIFFLDRFNTVAEQIAYALWVIAVIYAGVMAVDFVLGFPVPVIQETFLKSKSLRKPFEFSFLFFVLGVLIHPNREKILGTIKEKAERFAAWPGSIWVLSFTYFLLFLWGQITRYLSLEINFIPFLFYDYMLWFFEQGKFCFTGFLHGYYHVNLILLLVYPVWKVFHSTWVLHVAQPLIAALAAVPFFFWTRDQMKNPLLALIAAFLFLNYRYLQNVLSVNFAVELFYPLFIFSAVFFASRRMNFFYYLSVLLGLLIKEDAPLYFGALGFAYLIARDWRRGLTTLFLSAGYGLFILKVFLPWSGSTILKGDEGNFELRPTELFQKPWIVIRELFIPKEKIETIFKLTSKLIFLPFASPWFFLVLAAILPLFFRPWQPIAEQSVDQFLELSLYYSAPVLPFLFLAFVHGWTRLKTSRLYGPAWIRWAVPGLLIFLNAFNFRPEHFTKEDLATIQTAKTLPRDQVVVTQGHLLPYLGYRKWNFYIAGHYANEKESREAYLNPDYYFFDFGANAYPLTPQQLRDKADALKNDSRYQIRHEDQRRLLLETNL